MQKGENTVQICSSWKTAVRAMPIALDPAFPIHAPYVDRLHYSRPHPADAMHYHASCEVGICLQGSGIFYIGSRVYRYAAGDVSIIAPGVVHIAQSDPVSISGWKFLDIDMPRLLAPLGTDYQAIDAPTFCGILHPEDIPALAPLVLLILDELRSPSAFSRELIRLKVGELAILLKRRTANTATMVLPDSLSEISPAVLHIVNHYQEHITLAQLASMCSKSVSSFRRAFEQTMHSSPFEYLYHVRVKAAISLLQTTELPVTEIAARVGYQTLSSFNRHFNRIAGMPPMACRKKERPGGAKR